MGFFSSVSLHSRDSMLSRLTKSLTLWIGVLLLQPLPSVETFRVSTDRPNLFFVEESDSVQDITPMFETVGHGRTAEPPTQFLFVVDDLPNQYLKIASDFPWIHFAEQLAGAFLHEERLIIAVVPLANKQFLTMLKYRYDLLPEESEWGGQTGHRASKMGQEVEARG